MNMKNNFDEAFDFVFKNKIWDCSFICNNFDRYRNETLCATFWFICNQSKLANEKTVDFILYALVCLVVIRVH